MIGQVFGRLTVIEQAEYYFSSDKRFKRFLCLCSCGNQRVVHATTLQTGKAKSCGCLRKEISVARFTKHGMCRSRTYESWGSMIRRCGDPKRWQYKYYGGRGITVCERWKTFANFLADMGERPVGKSIDRYPDVNGNYQPENCRWASGVEQARNKRGSKIVARVVA